MHTFILNLFILIKRYILMCTFDFTMIKIDLNKLILVKMHIVIFC